MKLLKFPRTRHLSGSCLQTGDTPDHLPMAALSGVPLIVEEKLDGANAAVSFDPSGQLLLQSRGHYLTGGGRERHFALFKTWAATHQTRLFQVLGARYVMYGEWMYAKHTCFYDTLPHYFLEFDLFDREKRVFLSTNARRAVLAGLPVMPVPILHNGPLAKPADLQSLINTSLYKSPPWRAALMRAAEASHSRAELVAKQTEDSDLAEGLYVKQEEGDQVVARYKFVRDGFRQTITASDGHWQSRPILPNGLAPGVDILAQTLGGKGAYDET
ncbi:RNA ligase family protein [Tropicibacter sp. R15_0]|uniref:RNA ligase family protein n=1 Tax=Tropicibacter sp. R15_0 TaxID=2821101 RepID=UPI001ADBFBDD|nr:RNA ligase family protein [Tropicibacter sp. R15_0]MBO9466977.1 RNA ligase family protein [Tropicibacter sp. R15_0]